MQPILRALAGAKPPDGLAGRGLRPLWEDENARVRESVFLPFGDLMRSDAEVGPRTLTRLLFAMV